MPGFLTPEQRSKRLHELKVEDQAKYSDRIKVILLLDEDKTYKDISDFLFLDEGTIRNSRKRYVLGGIFGPIPKKKRALSNYPQSKVCMDSKEMIV